MNSQSLAALISSLISQIIIIIFLFFPPSNTLSITTDPNSSSFPQQPLLPFLHHFLATADVAAALSFSRKRKRPTSDDSAGSTPGRLASVLTRNPDSFKQFFRMKASTFEWLCGLLEPLLDCRDPVDSPLNLPAETRLGIGLFRLATGADHHEISSRFRVSESDSRFCVKQLCRVLCTNYRFWVGFPDDSELESVSAQFQTLTGLPNCCGVVSCTRFPIETNPPNPTPNPNDAVAAQIVVDSSSRILSIVAGFRGSKTDSQILKSSNLYKDIEKGLILNSQNLIRVDNVDVPQYLVGNGDYPLLPWLLLPFMNHQSQGGIEENLNNVINLMRAASFKAVQSLRNWGVLVRPLKEDHKAAVACIGACSILHNMLVMREDYSAFCDEFDDRGSDKRSVGGLDGNEEGIVMRKALATRAKILD